MGFLIDNNVYDDFLDFYFRTSIFKSFVLTLVYCFVIFKHQRALSLNAY